ncbi:FAD-dependent oxidoreductase [Candidatus Babeliales bacterium]|nr:FAD-dependent oxidoreductase [Candidatus Babeliales bacterium]
MPEVVILGAGLTGLSCAYNLEKHGFFDFQIFEKDSYPGGLLRSFKQDGFTFDYTGHLLHVNNNDFYNFLKDISDINNFDLVTRNSAIFMDNKIVPYPFQMNLAGLDTNIIINCIYDFINKKNIKVKSFHDWAKKHFGKSITKYFFDPYNSKLLSYDTKKITPSWTGRFVPKTDLRKLLTGALSPDFSKNIGYNSQFYYPKQGGIQFLIDNICKKLKNKIYTNHNAIKIDFLNKIIYFENGNFIKYKKLISTLPLNSLLDKIEERSDTNLKILSKKLLCNSVINFNLGFNTNNLGNKHWIYYPEKQFNFYRIGFWNNINPNSTPENHTAIYGETSCLSGTKTDTQIKILKEQLLEKSIEQALKKLNLKQSNIATKNILHIKHAYVIYDFWREKNLNQILKSLEHLSINSIGRFGEWKYSSMQEAYLDAKKTTENLLKTLLFDSNINISKRRGNNEAVDRIL